MLDTPEEELIESIKNAPKAWAKLILIQDKLIQEYERDLLDCRARLEFLLKDPDERDH